MDEDVKASGAASEPTPEIEAVKAELATLRQELAAQKRERAIAQALESAGIIDADVGVALIEKWTQGRGDEAISGAVAELKKRKPQLFARGQARQSAPSPTMAGRVAERRGSELSGAAALAASSGDRAALLRYLRLRREAAD